MLFVYNAITNTGEKKQGTVEAPSKDLAISALQRRALIVTSVIEESKSKGLLSMSLFEHVSMKDIVIMSRQISTYPDRYDYFRSIGQAPHHFL